MINIKVRNIDNIIVDWNEGSFESQDGYYEITGITFEFPFQQPCYFYKWDTENLEIIINTDETSIKHASTQEGFIKPYEIFVQIEDTKGHQNIANIQPTTVLFDYTYYVDNDYFLINNSGITVGVTGSYEISYHINYQSTHMSSSAALIVMKNSEYVDKTVSNIFGTYGEYIIGPRTNDSSPVLVELNEGDFIKLVGYRTTGVNTIITVEKNSWFKMKFVDDIYEN